jgi:GGDEF domain-containing protein
MALKVWGKSSTQDGYVVENNVEEKDPSTQAPEWIRSNSYGSEHLDAVYKYLVKGMRTSQCAKAPDFVHNTRRRYEIKQGRFYYKRGRRVAKNLPRRMARATIPSVEVLRGDEAWRVVEADHKKYHDGHNRAEGRLANLYMIVGVRALTQYARAQCKVCEGFEHQTKDAVQPIMTTRPMELIMFDLFFLPFADDEGQSICMMIIDHFTKYKWGATMTKKTMHEVAEILISVFRQEGNCERWHCDNGKEFINHVVTHARQVLNIAQMSTGRPRHPQCQGLVERANGTCKRKVLMTCLGEGMANGDKKWNWKKHLEAVLMNENDAPLKVHTSHGEGVE